jgi:alpha-tubulin suppressor-like RCC1 family protein
MHRKGSRWSALLASLLGIVLWAGLAAAEDGRFHGRGWHARDTLVAGEAHSLAVDAEGHVWALGANGSGQLGDGTYEQRSSPVRVQNLSGIRAVAAGYSHSLALRRDGTVWAWGYNIFGQLGLGSDQMYQLTPVQVPGLTDVVAITAVDYHSLALRRDGTVWAWGYNIFGQLGDGTYEHRFSPVQVQGLTDIVTLETGFSHALAVRRDGTVWAWGNNWDGQLGDGTQWNDRATAVQVLRLTDVVDIAAGTTYSLALRRDGTVWGWGLNGAGELGNGTYDTWITPVQVPDFSDVVDLSASYQTSMALRRDGTVWAWGLDWDGLFATGTNSIRLSPGQVPGVTDMASISLGGSHVLALRRDGTLWGWGRNSFDQLGAESNGVILPSPIMDLRHTSHTYAQP